MEYKLNKYLFYKEDNANTHVINLLNEVFFTLEKSKAEILKSGNIDLIFKDDNDLFEKLKNLNVIISKNINQLDLICIKNRNEIYNNRVYRLTINPTLECNFKCWYCYEEHPKGKMSESTMQSVIKHIRKKVEVEKISNFQLDWFGGEPLLYFDEIMYPLLLQIREIVNEHHVNFTSSITTNGFYINEERVKRFEEVGLNSFQITLDGNKEQHDKIRNTTEKKGSYDQIINNINLLSQMENVNIALRINYTKKTLIKINDIIPQLSKQAQSKVTVKFQQVWQDSAKKKISSDDCEQNFINYGIKVDRSSFNTKSYVCYADKIQQAVINYDGKVFKCTARDFSTYAEDGILLETGDIEWDLVKYAKRFGKATFENKHCLDCNLLPVCFGPCSQKMMEFDESTDDFKRICYRGGVLKIIDRDVDQLK